MPILPGVMTSPHSIGTILDTARAAGRQVLLESEGLALLRSLDIRVPRTEFLPLEARDWPTLPGERVVLKAVSPQIVHKTELGAVAIVANDAAHIGSALAQMRQRLAGRELVGFLLQQFLPYDRTLGHELLLGLRWSDEFGPVLALGLGGVHAEVLQKSLQAERGLLLSSPFLETRAQRQRRAQDGLAAELCTRPQRGQAPLLRAEQLTQTLNRLAELSHEMPHGLRELEINPLVVHEGELWALDVVCKLGDGQIAVEPERPRDKLDRLLRPASIALMGVSARLNPGHQILRNLLAQGFDATRISIIKPDTEQIEGCRCLPSLSALPEAVDLLVLAIDAQQTPSVVIEAIERQCAESIIVIPGGLEETQGGRARAAAMQEALRVSRSTAWRGPLINGGNCLGVLALPGRLDTMFIPPHKVGSVGNPTPRLAFLSQSGAFAVAKRSKWARLGLRYSISVGNQMDLCLGDYLEHLQHDREISVFAVYVEGFRPLDGQRFLRAASAIRDSGRPLILYRAGRTAEGANAAASHTAAMAGDYEVTRQLATAAGVLVASTIEEFEDLVLLCDTLSERPLRGVGLGAISNAGFECVAIADTLGRFQLAALSDATHKQLRAILTRHHLDGVVDVHNPLDLTPQMDAAGYEAALRALLADDAVQFVLFSCVPLTPALATLPVGPGHDEDLHRIDALPARLALVHAETDKPIVAVVDGGTIYDDFAAAIAAHGIPTFRSVDRALRVCDRVIEWRY